MGETALPIHRMKSGPLGGGRQIGVMLANGELGFLYVDGRYKQNGGLFTEGAVGHVGHTGQSVFVDCNSGLYAIILSDATISTVKKYGKEHYDEVMAMRTNLHAAIKRHLQEA